MLDPNQGCVQISQIASLALKFADSVAIAPPIMASMPLCVACFIAFFCRSVVRIRSEGTDLLTLKVSIWLLQVSKGGSWLEFPAKYCIRCLQHAAGRVRRLTAAGNLRPLDEKWQVTLRLPRAFVTVEGWAHLFHLH
jgi:hypothetical protein